MKNSYWFGALLLLTTITKNIFTCPFIIYNDTGTKILIVDPYNKQALYINPGNDGEIDPSISGWRYYFYHEKLDIYLPQKDNPITFYRRYQLVEKYCTAEKSNLTLSNIIEFINRPTDRFTTTEFKLREHGPHLH